MKTISLFISFFCIFSFLNISARCVNITTPHGTTLYIEDTTTVAELFRKCRTYGFYDPSSNLVLHFGNYEIIEDSEAAGHCLYYYGRHVEYATMSYNTHSHYDIQDFQTRRISIRTPNGMTATVRANQTPAYFFRSCRSAGNYSKVTPMTLKFDNYEIKENTPAANKYFYEFNTDASSAFVRHWDYNPDLDAQVTALFGTAICGVGFLYFLSLLK